MISFNNINYMPNKRRGRGKYEIKFVFSQPCQMSACVINKCLFVMVQTDAALYSAATLEYNIRPHDIILTQYDL